MGTARDTSPSNASPKAQRARQSWDEREPFLLRALIILRFCRDLPCKSQNFIWQRGKRRALAAGEPPPPPPLLLPRGRGGLEESACEKVSPLWARFAKKKSCEERSGTEGCGGRGQDGDACDPRAHQPDRRTSSLLRRRLAGGISSTVTCCFSSPAFLFVVVAAAASFQKQLQDSFS